MQLISLILPSLFFLGIVQSHDGHEHHEHHSSSDNNNNSTTPTPIDWTHQSTDLKKFVGVDFKWKADDKEWITMEMSTRTKGYVSVGFCPEWHGSMQDCDIVIGGVDDHGAGYLADYYATENVEPVKDESQDYQLVSAEQVNWLTKITFKRKWNTGDAKDVNLEEKKVQLIWSWSPEDVKGSKIMAHDKNTRGHTKTMISLKSPPPENGLRGGSSATASPFNSIVIFTLLFFVTQNFV